MGGWRGVDLECIELATAFTREDSRGEERSTEDPLAIVINASQREP